MGDNVNLHKREAFRRAIEYLGAILVQLPGYSLDLNPVMLKSTRDAQIQSFTAVACSAFLACSNSQPNEKANETSDSSETKLDESSPSNDTDDEFSCDTLALGYDDVLASSPKKIIAYYTAWSNYDRNYQVNQIPADKLSHINYAIANIVDGTCVLGDPWADVEKVFGDETTPTKGIFGHCWQRIWIGSMS